MSLVKLAQSWLHPVNVNESCMWLRYRGGRSATAMGIARSRALKPEKGKETPWMREWPASAMCRRRPGIILLRPNVLDRSFYVDSKAFFVLYFVLRVASDKVISIAFVEQTEKAPPRPNTKIEHLR